MSGHNTQTEPHSTAIQSQVSPWLTPLAYFLFFRFILPVYFGKIEVEGTENLPQTGAVILAPTHRSRWDPILLGAVAGRRVTGRDLRYMVSLSQTTGLQGWFIRRLGGFPIDREHPGTASLRYSIELLQDQQVLVLFPEGYIFSDDRVQPLQSGVARIALKSLESQPDLQLNIVPISIRYQHPAPPPWGCRVWIKIGSGLNVRDYDRLKSTKQAAQTLTTDLEIALKQLHQPQSI
ncbi:MAG: lysophospholipid acyltransferase family protein [Microcoleaceae cyanobacterium]